MSWDSQAAHDRRLIGNLTAEQKLWACVILKAIADQDPSTMFEVSYQKTRLTLSKQAIAWLKSPEYYAACQISGIANELFNSITPQQAAQLYYKLLSN